MRSEETYASIDAGLIKYGPLYKFKFVVNGITHIMLLSDLQLEKLEVNQRFQTVPHIKVEAHED